MGECTGPNTRAHPPGRLQYLSDNLRILLPRERSAGNPELTNEASRAVVEAMLLFSEDGADEFKKFMQVLDTLKRYGVTLTEFEALTWKAVEGLLTKRTSTEPADDSRPLKRVAVEPPTTTTTEAPTSTTTTTLAPQGFKGLTIQIPDSPMEERVMWSIDRTPSVVAPRQMVPLKSALKQTTGGSSVERPVTVTGQSSSSAVRDSVTGRSSSSVNQKVGPSISSFLDDVPEPMDDGVSLSKTSIVRPSAFRQSAGPLGQTGLSSASGQKGSTSSLESVSTGSQLSTSGQKGSTSSIESASKSVFTSASGEKGSTSSLESISSFGSVTKPSTGYKRPLNEPIRPNPAFKLFDVSGGRTPRIGTISAPALKEALSYESAGKPPAVRPPTRTGYANRPSAMKEVLMSLGIGRTTATSAQQPPVLRQSQSTGSLPKPDVAKPLQRTPSAPEVSTTTLSPDTEEFDFGGVGGMDDDEENWLPIRRPRQRSSSRLRFFEDEEEEEETEKVPSGEKALRLAVPGDKAPQVRQVAKPPRLTQPEYDSDSTIEGEHTPEATTPERNMVVAFVKELEELFAHTPFKPKPSLALEHLSQKLSRMSGVNDIKGLLRSLRILRRIQAPPENIAFVFHDAYLDITASIPPPISLETVPAPMTPRSLVIRLRKYMTESALSRGNLMKNDQLSAYLEARAKAGDRTALREALELAEEAGTQDDYIAKNFEAAWRILDK